MSKIEVIPFEKPLADLESRIDELRRIASSQLTNMDGEIADLEKRAKHLRREMFSKLTAYESTQIARHPRRPNSLELISHMTSGFIELHGDRNFFDDKSVIGGLARIGDIPVMIIGHQKGRGTKDNIFRNFGMPRPEGYRKALRLMNMAERFQLPIVTLIDTPGAFPGVDAEERGQSEAIAKNIMVMTRLRVPIVTIVVGEGGSGGALALAVANRVYMLEYGIYSVISPEGCASILMKDASKASLAAEMLKITADSAVKLGIVDGVISEPEGGAHRDLALTADRIKGQILTTLAELMKKSPETLRDERFEKYIKMGSVQEASH
ncbi:MAG: acetyl-CoA carboxylase carboxyltransferase subunit alpha [Proteobacteria bacterium]|nr:acetyl-CoA carboxylase carboxyltransferase subunit alpha [Pseudomonadota bacterium]